jgi:hypothetical protein
VHDPFDEHAHERPVVSEAAVQWQQRGACRAHPAEVFFPDELRGRALQDAESRAKAICHQCPVVMACRAHAMSWPEAYGVWGELSPVERTYLRRRYPSRKWASAR